MTLNDALAELDRRFEEFVRDESATMRARGIPETIISAMAAENRLRFSKVRVGAAQSALGWPVATNDNALRH